MDVLTGFDIIVMVIIGVGAVAGFMRGFVQEVLTLGAWVLALFAIHYLHSDLTDWLYIYFPNLSASSVLAFSLLLLIPYAGMKLVASWAGRSLINSEVGPVDRVLGFGFGALKGMIIVVLAFSVLVLGYDSTWGFTGRPTWMTAASTYPYVNNASDGLVEMIDARRKEIEGRTAE